VAKRALDLDPASTGVSHVLAVQLYLARQFDQAIQHCRKTLEMDTNYAVAYAVLGQVYAARLYREALTDLAKFSVLSQGGAASFAGKNEVLALLGYSHARLGDRNEALRILDELGAVSKLTFVTAFFFALVYAGLEDKDQAFIWVETACEERFNRLAYLKVEALWDPLRPDPGFAELVRRVGIPA
jgi:tetratricopeptide (TPR) repeat protein